MDINIAIARVDRGKSALEGQRCDVAVATAAECNRAPSSRCAAISCSREEVRFVTRGIP